jgi:POT family proton-dependent oligopeptide transporter
MNLESNNATGLLGHPKGLMTLFFSEMWERSCYYGMRVLLTLYLVKSLMKGDAEASLIYGAYTGLVYAAPILGGNMADKFLGYRYAVLFGAILMVIGEFIIIGGTEPMLLMGMGALIIGNGYFKANISTIVGKLYADGDPKRDSGFTIFYIGINIGALIATTLIAWVGETHGFKWGFALAGFGMLLGFFIFLSGKKQFHLLPGVQIPEAGKKKVFVGLNMVQLISIGSLFLIPACYVLIQHNSIMMWLLLGLLAIVSYTLLMAGKKEDKRMMLANETDILAEKTGDKSKSIWFDRMIAFFILFLVNVVFWACFEQAGTSLTLFADRNVDRMIFDWEMPASMTQFFNPFFIIVFGSIFSAMWVKLSKMGKNPSIPVKFGLAFFQIALGFLVVKFMLPFANEEFQVPLITLILLYLLHTTGELFISPIGLSMVTKLAPKKVAGMAMGAWFLSWAMANYLGGIIASMSGGGHGEGGEVIKLTTQQGLIQYTEIFSILAYVLLGIGFLVILLNKPIQKLMHGVE